MLWSDPPDSPSEPLRAAQVRLRRAGLLLAAVVFVVTLTLSLQ